MHLMGAWEYPRQPNPDFARTGPTPPWQPRLIDAGAVPAVADIETQLDGTRNAVFASTPSACGGKGEEGGE